MQPGRQPGWNLIGDLEPGAWLEPVELASGDRLLLPAALRRRVAWCSPAATLALIASIGPNGEVKVVPASDRVDELEALKMVLSEAEESERTSLIFSAMAVFHRIALMPDGRLRLSPTLALHLAGASKRIWIGAHDNEITLWSEQAWSYQLATGSVSLREALTAAQQR